MVERGIVRFGLLLMLALPLLGFLLYAGGDLSCLSLAPFDFCWF
jgi:hypothetical protein